MIVLPLLTRIIRFQLLSASDQLKTSVRDSIENEFTKGAKALTNPELDKILDNTFNRSINTALASTTTDSDMHTSLSSVPRTAVYMRMRL